MDKIRLDKQSNDTFIRLYGDHDDHSGKADVRIFNEELLKRPRRANSRNSISLKNETERAYNSVPK